MHLCGIAKWKARLNAASQTFGSILAGHVELQYMYNVEDNGDVLRTEVHFYLHQQMYKKKEKKKESNGD